MLISSCPHLTSGVCALCYTAPPTPPAAPCGCRCGFPHAHESQAVQLVASWQDVLNAHVELVARAEKAEAALAELVQTGHAFTPLLEANRRAERYEAALRKIAGFGLSSPYDSLRIARDALKGDGT